MRDLVNKKSFLLRKKLDNLLHWLAPDWWVPLYTSVTFSRMRYHQCINNRSAILPHYLLLSFILLGSGKTRRSPGCPRQRGWPPSPPSGSSPTTSRPPPSQTSSWRDFRSKSQGWLSSARKVSIVSVGWHFKHDIFHTNKLAKLRRHASRVHFAKIHFG